MSNDEFDEPKPGTGRTTAIFAFGFVFTSWLWFAIGARISGPGDSHFGPYGWLIVPGAFAIMGVLLAAAGFGFGLIVSGYDRREPIVRSPRLAAWLTGPVTAAACILFATLARSFGSKELALIVYAAVPIAAALLFARLLTTSRQGSPPAPP